jgi:Na+-transporting NADH:ubiquinone oxidoreductase subunit NqrF
MIDHALLENNSTKKMKLFLGLTYKKEIFWKDHFDELAQKYPNFSYEIALFKPDEDWDGAKGFITELVKEQYPDASKCAAYLCGHRAMIADASDILTANGCPKERIYTERFV